MIKTNLDNYDDSSFDNGFNYDSFTENESKKNISIKPHYYHIDHKNDKKSGREKDKYLRLIYVVIIVFIALVGLFNVNNYFMYLFGFLFFCAGFFVGNRVPIFGLIFLCSHCGSGLMIMTGTLLFNSSNNFIEFNLLDNNLLIKLGDTGFVSILGFLVGLACTVGVSGVIFSIVNNILSINMDKNENLVNKLIIVSLSLFAMFFLLVGIISKFYL